MTLARSLCVPLLAIAAWGCAHAPMQAPRYAALDTMLDKESRELALPGISMAMMEHGRIVWAGARGWADYNKRIPATADTVFNIASLTKPMTAVVLMQLVEAGKLNLDTPMQRYDPSYKDPRITVGHVLSMRSESDPPGSAYSYNGNPYGTLDTVIRGVAGEELGQAFSSRIIEPLGLKQTSPGSLKDPKFAKGLSPDRVAHYESIMARLAKPHNVYAGTEIVETFPVDPEPNAAANVVSTASDYARFADAVMSGRLLKPETLARMWTAPVLAKGERSPYAYGWFVEDYGGHRIIYHYGYYPNAYSAVMMMVPDRELVFVAIANGHSVNAGNGIDPIEGHVMACAVLVNFVDPALPCAEKAAANVAKWRSLTQVARHQMAPDPAAWADVVGSYRRSDGVPAKVFIQNGKLWWQTVYQPFEMTQEAPDRFFMKADDRTLVFVRDPSGKVIRVDITFPLDKNVYPLPRM
jgi:CubicO group peptidase (beta-lactamase class C family)